MEHKIEFISINCNGEEREWHMTPTEMYEEYNGKCDLPDLGDTIVSCLFAGTRLYFETFNEIVYTFFGGNVSGMTTQEKWEEIYNVLDDMSIKYDTNYCGSETEALIEFWTDTARQDIPTEFDYDGTPEDFVKQFTERAEMYDVDEEVEVYVHMRGKNGVPNTIRKLFDDCQEAKDTLMEIAKKLQEAIK